MVRLIDFTTIDLNLNQFQWAEFRSLYTQRWQIELFFKWIKQNLKVKLFVGRSENAVLIPVLPAMICLLATQVDTKLYFLAMLITENSTTGWHQFN
jgi:IS4 transposase